MTNDKQNNDMNNEIKITKYAFRTIVAPDAVRADFTALRDQLNSSDKELMQALWNLGTESLELVKHEVEMLQAEAANVRNAVRIEKQEVRAAAKRREKVEKEVAKAAKFLKENAPKVPKAKKKVVVKKTQAIVVDGLK